MTGAELLTPLRRVSAMEWVQMGLTLLLVASAYGLGGMARSEALEGRAAQADSVALAKSLESVIYQRDARTAHARAELEHARADTAAAIAAQARGDLATRVARAEASRARVDTAGLPAALLEALADGDALRIAITPALASDAAAIAGYQGTIVQLEATIRLKDLALAADSAALAARSTEVAELRKQHAPRCGWKCGAAIGLAAPPASRAVVALAKRLLAGRL